jgi:hypothetical protein
VDKAESAVFVLAEGGSGIRVVAARSERFVE